MAKPLLFALVAIYGGFFGAGMGVLTLAIGIRARWFPQRPVCSDLGEVLRDALGD